MVQILAPAGWLATGEAAPTPEPAEVAATAAPTISVRILTLLREHAVLWSAGAATAVVMSGLMAFLALRGGEERVAALPLATAAVEETVAAPSEEVERDAPPAMEVDADEQTVQTPPPAPMQPPPEKQAAVVVKKKPPAIASPQIAAAPTVTKEQSRTMTLEPVKLEPPANTTTATANYPTATEAETVARETKPAAARPPARVTNVVDQLSVPIESIDLPAMPIGEFVNLVSGMAAVPIRLDPKVLGEVGLSTRSTVTVRGESTTVGKLFAGVLKEHQLTCVERDGVLVVVKAKR